VRPRPIPPRTGFNESSLRVVRGLAFLLKDGFLTGSTGFEDLSIRGSLSSSFARFGEDNDRRKPLLTLAVGPEEDIAP
jgi:hypothetical protein